MKTTIDGAGRVVIPKAIRDRAGLQAGAELEIAFREGRIEIEPATVEVQLVHRKGRAVLALPPGVSAPRFTSEQTRLLIEEVRQERALKHARRS